MTDDGMPMQALVLRMPMPTYAFGANRFLPLKIALKLAKHREVVQ
jgi:hypothetical protein